MLKLNWLKGHKKYAFKQSKASIEWIIKNKHSYEESLVVNDIECLFTSLSCWIHRDTELPAVQTGVLNLSH